MKLTTRTTHSFIEIKVDEIETTIFKNPTTDANETIENLLDVIDDICRLVNKDFSFSIKDQE